MIERGFEPRPPRAQPNTLSTTPEWLLSVTLPYICPKEGSRHSIALSVTTEYGTRATLFDFCVCVTAVLQQTTMSECVEDLLSCDISLEGGLLKRVGILGAHTEEILFLLVSYNFGRTLYFLAFQHGLPTLEHFPHQRLRQHHGPCSLEQGHRSAGKMDLKGVTPLWRL